MKQLICGQCGSNEFFELDGYTVCKFCMTKHVKSPDELEKIDTKIELNEDIERLLQKCKVDPTNARRYASLVLDIDSNNIEAIRIIQLLRMN